MRRVAVSDPPVGRLLVPPAPGRRQLGGVMLPIRFPADGGCVRIGSAIETVQVLLRCSLSVNSAVHLLPRSNSL
jgi:hypothetical protein